MREGGFVGMEHYFSSGATLRRLFEADRGRFAAHLLRLDPASRRQRFTGGVCDQLIVRYAERCFQPRDVIFGVFFDGDLRGAGELRPDAERRASDVFGFEPPRAEAAFSVEERYRRKGFGAALLSRLLRAAGARGLETIDFTCQADNRAMRRLAEKFAADTAFHSDQISGYLTAQRVTTFACWRESSSDMASYAAAMIDKKMRELGRIPFAPQRGEKVAP